MVVLWAVREVFSVALFLVPSLVKTLYHFSRKRSLSFSLSSTAFVGHFESNFFRAIWRQLSMLLFDWVQLQPLFESLIRHNDVTVMPKKLQSSGYILRSAIGIVISRT